MSESAKPVTDKKEKAKKLKDVVIARAISKFNRVSMKKMLAVARCIKSSSTKKHPDLTYIKATGLLYNLPQKGAKVLLKTMQSAYSNILNVNNKVAEESVLVDEILIGEGPSFKRIKPRARGRADRYQKRTCHVTIYLKGMLN